MPITNKTNDELVIESPEDLTTVFDELLQRQFPQIARQGTSVQLAPLPQAAILSRVYEINVTFHNEDDQATPHPLKWVAKFLKSSLPLEEMFCVEGAFYRNHAQELVNDFIYIPKALYCGNKCIVLEYVEDTTSYSLLESCPSSRLEQVLAALAHIHGHFWKTGTTTTSLSELSSTAGIGTAMSGIEKERTFPKLWRECVAHVKLDNNAQQERLHDVCIDLTQRRLRDIHDRLHEHQPTLIHGDFHVGNLLFDTDDKRLTILDWATCGAGNNVIDVVFFFLISTKLTIEEMMQTWLPHYYRTLVKHDSVVDYTYSWETCVSDFRTCLLNQFLVLVCYDEISKQLLRTEVDSDAALQHFSQHFANVNKRCVEALLSDEMNLADYPLPPIKTESDDVVEETTDETSDNVIRLL